MDDLKWAVDVIIGILGILVGRTWEKYDRRGKKDKDTLEKLMDVFPDDNPTIRFLRDYDLGGRFKWSLEEPLDDLSYLLRQPEFFFLNKKVEKEKALLKTNLKKFLAYLSEHTFVCDGATNFKRLPTPDQVARERWDFLEARGMENISDIIKSEREEREEEHSKKQQKLNQLATDVYEAYIELKITFHKQI